MKLKRSFPVFLVIGFLGLSLAVFGEGEEDEISPETLPDELPVVTTIEVPAPEPVQERAIQSKATPSESQPEESKTPTLNLKSQADDAELEKPLTPLFPTEPVDLEDKNFSPKAEVQDLDLSKPDPSYVPTPEIPSALKNAELSASASGNAKSQAKPVVAKSEMAPPSPPKKPTLTPVTEESSHPKLPSAIAKAQGDPADPIETEMIVTRVEPVKPARVSQLKTTPKPTQHIPLVLAPQVLAQAMSDATHGIPIETFITQLAVPPTTPTRAARGVSDFSIILAHQEFYPAKLVMKSGSSIRLLFTTTNRKPAALVIERLNIQRWVASSDEGQKKNELDRSKFEINRELTASRVTEIEFEPKPGVYSFHDVITGASGEIVVEEP